MDRFTDYLRVPSHYAAGLKGLHWSPSGDAIEFDDGSTFVFPGEIFPFLEGFASQRPLIHFAHILHLLYLLLEPRTPFLGKHADALMRAFRQTQRPYRNAGVFCAILCADIPAVPDPLEQLPFWTGTFELEVGASEPFFTLQDGDMPALPGEVFEARVLFALSQHSFGEVHHWFRHGRGPVGDAGEEVAEKVLLHKPRSLQGILAELAQHQRLCGARPFVEQLGSALTLPPRRLEKPELPLGGFSDVTTHGSVEQLLPSQFAFDDLEFIRRHAEHELLYFRREDPHVHTREDLVVLLDQGVRTWGTVRLVLTAALFALGRLAERRRLPFLVAATSGGGELLDPLQAPAAELQEMIESSDLSPHPASVLEHVLTQETDTSRDVVLLTHPRNLAEPDVIAAARKLPNGARLFAVTVDDHGELCFSALRGGTPVCLNRFHVDLERTAPPPAKTHADPQTTWRGDVEPVPFPFRFGLADTHNKPIHLAFDAAGEWLLIATYGGFLHATRTDGSHGEMLPRGIVQNTIIAEVAQVIGVASGFVVVSHQPGRLLHYDFQTRTCTAHPFTPLPKPELSPCFYMRSLHTLVVPTMVEGRRKIECLHLSTGSRERPPAAFDTLDSRIWASPLPIQGEGEPTTSDAHWCWPQIHFDSDRGTIRLVNVLPPWQEFTPLEDNKPVLKGCELVSADCQGHTLAALFTNPARRSEATRLRLFHGPEGTPLAAFPLSHQRHRFVLSNDGLVLAKQVGRGHVHVRNVFRNAILQVIAVGKFHPQIRVELGECWMTLRIDSTVHLVQWGPGSPLAMKARDWRQESVEAELKKASLPTKGIVATLRERPPFLKLPLDPGSRFGPIAINHLIAVADRFGEVALFTPTGELVCMFFAFRQQIAVWMPDGTCHGPMTLLGRPATPHALEKIGAALRNAWQNSKGATV